MAFLEINHLSYSYFSRRGEVPALKDLHFHMDEGEFLALVGPSGCGKTTLLNLLCGLLTPSKGEILFDGAPLSTQTVGIGYMLQKDHLLGWRTTRQNACLGLEVCHPRKKKDAHIVDRMLDEYGLSDFAHRLPQSLSGGMRQRAALIRTLATKPSLLLLDEPFSALDYQTRLLVSNDIWSIIRKANITTILITHDVTEAIRMADRVLVLTRLPASIRAELPIPEEIRLASPMTAGDQPAFSRQFNLIWKELMQA